MSSTTNWYYEKLKRDLDKIKKKKLQEEDKELIPDDIIEFITKFRIIRGRPFLFDYVDPNTGVVIPQARKYLYDIYRTAVNPQVHDIIITKGRQMEISELAVNVLLYFALKYQDRHLVLLYTAPRGDQVSRFSNRRLRIEAIKQSKLIRKYLTGTDATETVQLGNCTTYLYSAWGEFDAVRNIDADVAIVDEAQDIQSSAFPVIRENMAHSWLKKFIVIGTPKEANSPFENLWNMSDRREWDKETGKWIKTVSEPRPFVGFHVSQEMAPWITKEELEAKKMHYTQQQFYNEVLGLFYKGLGRPITIEDLFACTNRDIGFQSFAEDTYAGVDWGCYDEQTRTLTNRGFKYYWEITSDDLIAQFDPQTEEMSFVKPLKKIVFHHRGKMVRIKNKHQDMLITPDHKCIFRKEWQKKWTKCEAQDLLSLDDIILPSKARWKGENKEYFILPSTIRKDWNRIYEEKKIDMKVWLEFLGYFLSDGCVAFRNADHQHSRMVQVQICQRNVHPYKVNAIRNVLNKLPFKYGTYFYEKYGDYQFKIANKQLYEWLANHCGADSKTKHIPREFLELSPEYLRILLDSLMLGDGYWSKNKTGGTYYTISKQLADDVFELTIKLGFNSHLSYSSGKYRINFSLLDKKRHIRGKNDVEIVDYDGMAYCFSVPTGFFVTERNGYIAFQGNTSTKDNADTVYWCIKPLDDGKIHTVFISKIDTPDIMEQVRFVAKYIDRYDNRRVVVDWGFGHVQTQELQKMYGMRVLPCDYSGSEIKPVEIKLTQTGTKLHLNRTLAIDTVFDLIKKKNLVIPGKNRELTDWLYKNFMVMYQESEVSTTGKNIRRWVKDKGEDAHDDAVHALVYAYYAYQTDRTRKAMELGEGPPPVYFVPHSEEEFGLPF